ncbi:DNA-binding protein RHL1-like [Primulina tabacum]|uniref:DNA-binding protein RHL1-like n=1 Tax=Primulina tabacum TaxID=48773 RepID=UPI003F5A3344
MHLFLFSGLLGPISGLKIGELEDLGTKNPVLYSIFPQGQMKLFGTNVYPKNRYLTLQFSKGRCCSPLTHAQGKTCQSMISRVAFVTCDSKALSGTMKLDPESPKVDSIETPTNV